jgi:acyl carrier protein
VSDAEGPALDEVLDVVVRSAGRHLEHPRHLGSDAADADLASLGLTSLGMISLLVELEHRWSVQLPTERIVRETFSSPRTLAAAFAPLVDGSS